MPMHRVYFATEASTVVEVELPEGATWAEIAEAADANLDVRGLCTGCSRDYTLADPVLLLVDDEPDPDAVDPVEKFRAALIEHFQRSEPQTLGLHPYSGDFVSAWCDVIADFQPEG